MFIFQIYLCNIHTYIEQLDEENNLNINENNNIKLEDMNSNNNNNITNSTSKHNLNSLTLVSDLQDRTNLDVDSIINKHLEEEDINQQNIDEMLNIKNNNQQINSPDSYGSQSTSSPSASSYSSQSPSYLNEDKNNININTKYYQYDSFNEDANPRKHSPGLGLYHFLFLI